MSTFQSGKKVKSKVPEFIEIEFLVNGLPMDALSGTLYSLGCVGIHEVDQERWRVYFNKNSLTGNAAEMTSALKKLNPAFAEKDITISKLSNRDWNEEWRKYFQPIEPAKDVWIRPPWETLPPGANGMEIIIDPQMAFGTGHHETTALMIRLMKEISFHNASVLDVGTGSGILAIFAGKLGSRSVAAIDNDSNAIANVERNMKLNRINNIDVKCVALESMSKLQFEVILANINYEVLSSSASKITQMLTEKGKLIISGILKKEAREIESLYEGKGLRLLKQEDLNDWAALMLERCT